VKKKLRIGQYFTKIWTKLCGLLFCGHPVHSGNVVNLVMVGVLE